MSKQIRLDYSEIQKAIERAKAERAKTLRRYGVALAAIGSKVRARRTFAVIAVLLISFGAKMFFFSAPTAAANTQAAPSVSWPLP
jgi:hypothetical protein